MRQGFFILLISILTTVHSVIAQDSLKLKIQYTDLKWLENNIVMKPDSDILFFHHYNLLYFPAENAQTSYFYSNTGNIGSPSFNLVFVPDLAAGHDAGLHFYDIYRLKNDEARYFDTWTPFTRLYYVQGPKELQVFHAMHSRNITPHWNFTLLYRGYVSDGFYMNQAVKNKNLSMTTRYTTRNGRYKLFASALKNDFRSGENGGITNDSLFQQYTTRNKTGTQVRLNSARQDFSEWDFSVLQIFNLTKKDTSPEATKFGYDHLSIQHQIKYNESIYKYSDNLTSDTGYYREIFIDSAVTADRFTEHKLSNFLQFNYNWNFKINKFVSKKNFLRTGLFHETGSVTGDTIEEKFNNIGAFLKTKITLIPDIDLFADMNYILAGDNRNDYAFSEGINLGPVKAGMHHSSKSPGYIQEHMFSNHLKWKNDFEPVVSNGFFVKLPLNRQSIVNVNFVTLKNYIYFSDSIKPVQENDKIRVLSGELFLFNKLGHFRFVNRLFYQYCSEQQLFRLPDWIVENISFYENSFFKDVLKIQVGFDVRFINGYEAWSRYAPYNIMYAGIEEKLPYTITLDLFLNANVKRMNFFLKYENVNYGYPRDYNYLLPHYPAEPRAFRFGLSWMFFD